MALTLPASHPDLSDLNQNGKNRMKQFLKMTAAPASAMLALAFVAMTTPASTAAPTSRPTCKAAALTPWSNVRTCLPAGGSCDRDPFLATTSSAYAYQAKPSHSKRPAQAAKRPVEGR